jgi:hypothetical protein
VAADSGPMFDRARRLFGETANPLFDQFGTRQSRINPPEFGGGGPGGGGGGGAVAGASAHTQRRSPESGPVSVSRQNSRRSWASYRPQPPGYSGKKISDCPRTFWKSNGTS